MYYEWYSGCINVCSHQQHKRVEITPHPCQNLVFFIFFLVTILVSLKCFYCIVVFNLHFFPGEWSQSPFHLFTAYFVLLWIICSSLLSICLVGCCLFLIVLRVLCMFWTWVLCWIYHCSSLSIRPVSLTSSDVLPLIKWPQGLNYYGMLFLLSSGM